MVHRLLVAVTLLGCCAATASTAGCGVSREQVLTYLLDPPRDPPTPTRRTRRDLLQEVGALERELEETRTQLEHERSAEKAPAAPSGPPPPAERGRTWPEAAEHLPRRADGSPDWVSALASGAIRPRGAPGGGDPPAVLDLDVDLSPALGVTFSHRSHTELLACASCHPRPFKESRGESSVTMEQINRGESCGACHGPVAFGPNQCERCHEMKATSGTTWKPPEPRTPVERARTWEEAARLLPATAGAPDWVRALTEGIIAPRPGIDPGTPERATMSLDLELDRSGSPIFKALFPHAAHTALLGCDTCHAGLYEPRRGATAITMAQINAGESCGVCHGKVAFGADQCARCHTALPGPVVYRVPEPRTPIERARTWEEAAKLLPARGTAPDWVKALADGIIAPRAGADPAAPDRPGMPLDVERVPPGSNAFKATFPHAAHTAILACESCHTTLFQMQKGSTEMSMAQIYAGEGCGACHGKVAFGVDQCARCHTALPAPVAWRAPEPRTPIERARTWEEAAKALPLKGSAPDWVKALADGVIAPRAGADPAAPDRPGMPLDVERVPAESPAFKSVFPHASHTAVLACESCHTALFQMQKGASDMSMAQIYRGEGCGACHGKVAFSANQCARCHTGVPAVTEWRPGPARKPIERARAWEEAERLLPVAAGGPDWAKALAEGVIAPRAGADPAAPERQVMPLDVIFGPAVPGTHKVLFSHASHTAVLGCESCHPAIYQMQRGANPVSMARILAGESCGVCHGKVAFPVQACGRCHSIIPGGTS